jgi:lipoate-protein ligase A
MAPLVQLLPFAAADGPANMAADELLLEEADRGVASLRFYTWTVPTLSLGYFQRFDAAQALGSSIPIVRRSSGGAAILHHHELTYALALPAGKRWQTSESWTCRFHRLAGEVLARAGVASRMVGCGEERKLGEVLCFFHQTAGDLLIEDSKVAGSAQRKRRGALLQHGSLLLDRSAHAPSLPGINDAAGRDIFTAGTLAEALLRHFEAESGWRVEPLPWTAEMQERANAIREKYAGDEWSKRR